MEKETFASRLRTVMEERGISRSKLSEMSGISTQAIGQYLLEKRNPDFGALSSLSRALGVSCDFLIGLSEVRSINASLRSVCEYTGLSQEAVSSLHVDKIAGFEDNASIVAEFLSRLVLSDELKRIVAAVRQYKGFCDLGKQTVHLMATGEDIDVGITDVYLFAASKAFERFVESYSSEYPIEIRG